MNTLCICDMAYSPFTTEKKDNFSLLGEIGPSQKTWDCQFFVKITYYPLYSNTVFYSLVLSQYFILKKEARLAQIGVQIQGYRNVGF